MSKWRNDFVQEILENSLELDDGIVGDLDKPREPEYFYQVFQKRPYTFVHIWPRESSYLTLTADQPVYYGLGFSKVCYPDTWDAQKGKDIALRKAAAHMVNQAWPKHFKPTKKVEIEVLAQ